MDLLSSLEGAFALLKKEPKVFVPRLFTTVLYTIFTLYSISIAADFYLNQDNPAYLQENSTLVLALFFFALLLYLIDIVSYAMYPKIVEDHIKGNEISLRKALLRALKAWPTIIALAVLLFILLLVVSLTTGISEWLYLTSGNWLYVLAAFVAVVAILIVFAVLVFFVTPIAVVENQGVMESFRKSFKMGMENKKELFQLNVFFAILVLPTMLLAAFTEFQGQVSYAAILLFLLIRILQAIAYTYISITNPYIYMSLKGR